MKFFALLVFAFANVTALYAQKSFGFSYNNDGKQTVVLTVFKNGPAAKAGFQTGDIITAINFNTLYGLNLNEVTKIFSEANDNSTMSLMRNGAAINDVKITRADRSSFLNVCVSGDCQNGIGEFIGLDGYQYNGSFKNGVKTGNGKMAYFDNKVYTGNWANNKPNGKGKEVFKNGNTYEGDMVNGLYEGVGKYTQYNGETYTGTYKAGKLDGTIKHTLSEGTFIEIYSNGQLVSSKKEDVSTPPLTANAPEVTNECVSGNCVNGKGTIKNKYYTYEGDFVDGKQQGQGTRTDYTGDTYTGQFANNKFNGKGKYKYGTGTYEGDFVDGKREGQGTDTKASNIYTGQFKNDKRNGHGKEESKFTKVVKEGIWKDNVYVGPDDSKDSKTSTSSNETATLLRETLNGKFEIMEGKPLVYVLTNKKTNETLRYQIEFINDGGKFAFKWKELSKNQQSEKLVIDETALGFGIKYVNFFTVKTPPLPKTVVMFILSRFQFDELKSRKEISLEVGNGLQRFSYTYSLTASIMVYTNKDIKVLHYQSDDRATKIQVLDDRVCPLIVAIETPEYKLTLVSGG